MAVGGTDCSGGTNPPREPESRGELPLNPSAGESVIETADLHHAPTTILGPSEGDYAPVETFEDAKYVCRVESTKLWVIAGPIAFNILCNYGVNSFTNIFVGHIGNVELSAVAISLSVIANFSFGFLVSYRFFLHSYLFVFSSYIFHPHIFGARREIDEAFFDNSSFRSMSIC